MSATLGPAAVTFDYPGASDDVDALYQERGWTDGLPIVPPTEARVAACLRWTDRDPREIVGVLPPRQGEATVEKIAVNTVMAGCKPEYLPVVITAIEALADPLFNLDSVQATTHPVAPLAFPPARPAGDGDLEAVGCEPVQPGEGFRPGSWPALGFVQGLAMVVEAHAQRKARTEALVQLQEAAPDAGPLHRLHAVCEDEHLEAARECVLDQA